MNRPEFNENITLEEFQNHYWYLLDLKEICKKYNIPTSGGKIVLEERLKKFIKSGFDKNLKFEEAKTKSSKQEIPKNLDEKMPKNFKSTEEFRSYFKSIIGEHFHFTAYMMKYCREHKDMTYRDFVNEWQSEYERRKDKSYKPDIMKSTRYNQYIRDFFEANPDRTFKDAVKCWNYRRDLPGKKVYSKDDLDALNI